MLTNYRITFYPKFKKARAYWLTSSKNSEPATAKNAAFHHTRTVAAIKNAVMQQNKMRELQSQVKRLTAQVRLLSTFTLRQ